MNPALRLLAADDKAMMIDGVDSVNVDGGGVAEGDGVDGQEGDL